MKNNKIPRRRPQNNKEIRKVEEIKLTRQESYIGPIPQAEELQKYNNIQEDFAERIVIMAEKEQHARHELEKESSRKMFEIERKKISVTKNGQWFALIAIIIILIFATLIAALGDTKSSAAVVITVLVAIVATFMGIKRQNKN